MGCPASATAERSDTLQIGAPLPEVSRKSDTTLQDPIEVRPSIAARTVSPVAFQGMGPETAASMADTRRNVPPTTRVGATSEMTITAGRTPAESSLLRTMTSLALALVASVAVSTTSFAISGGMSTSHDAPPSECRAWRSTESPAMAISTSCRLFQPRDMCTAFMIASRTSVELEAALMSAGTALWERVEPTSGADGIPRRAKRGKSA